MNEVLSDAQIAAVHRLKDEGLYYRDIADQLNMSEVLVARVIGGFYHRPAPHAEVPVYVPEKPLDGQASCENPVCQKNAWTMRQEIGSLKRSVNRLKVQLLRNSGGLDKEVAAQIRRISESLSSVVDSNGIGRPNRRHRMFDGDE